MPIRLLFVCTANMCRSPMAAALMRLRLAADPTITVGSAGLLAGGRPVPPEVLAAMEPFGIDLSGHRSTQLNAAMLADANLVVGMTRRHVREVALLDDTFFDRTFTLKELVRRGDQIAPRSPDQELEEWITAISGDRGHGHIMGRSAKDDIADPIGRSPAHFQETAAELADLVEKLAVFGLRGDRPTVDGGRESDSVFPPEVDLERRGSSQRRSGRDRRTAGREVEDVGRSSGRRKSSD